MKKEELIAKYLRNQLTDTETQELERLLASDADFKEQFTFETQVQAAFFEEEHTKKKEFLKAVERDKFSKTAFGNKWFLLAASIAAFMVIGYFWLQSSQSPEQLYASYYETAQNTTKPIVRNGEASDKLTRAFIAYENRDFQKAQTLMAEGFETTANSELLFYEAISFMELNDLDRAITTFKTHQTYNDKLQGKSRWYLALAYLKVGKIEPAKVLLTSLSENTSSYNSEKAREILSKL